MHLRRIRLAVEPLGDRIAPAISTWSTESFDSITRNLPANWSSTGGFAPTARLGVALSGALATSAAASGNIRAWGQAILPENQGVEADIRLTGKSPGYLLFRGQALATSHPSFYAVIVSSSGSISLLKTLAGSPTVLGKVQAKGWPRLDWVQVRVAPLNDVLRVEIMRADTGQYLSTKGDWQTSPAYAIQVTDGAIRGDGQAGVQRPAGASGRVLVDNFTLLAPDSVANNSFDGTAVNSVPSNWFGWGSDGSSGFAASAVRTVTGNSLASSGSSAKESRVWLSDPVPADSVISASVFADSLIPAEIFARGTNLASTTPSYYSASVVRGTTVTLEKTLDGVTTDLGSITSNSYVSGVWLNESLITQGDALQVRLERSDTGEWLDPFGDWETSATAAITVNDSDISGAGRVGLGRSAGYAGAVYFDDFSIRAASEDVLALQVTAFFLDIARSQQPGAFSGPIQVRAITREAGTVARVEFLVDGNLIATKTASPYALTYDTRDLSNGTHQLDVRAWDEAGNVGQTIRAFNVFNSVASTKVTIPRHYSHIRIAALAYYGNPMGSFETQLLKNSIDLVVPNTSYLGTISSASPATPQLIYSNVSNIYQDLLTDWLNYADENGLSRENAFYHVAQATPFTGDSASSQPVNWFWNVQRGPLTGTSGFKALTAESHSAAVGDVALGAAGQAVYVGYPDQFREINLQLSRNAAAPWNGILEYPSAVDASGKPTAWKSVPLESDATNGFHQSGRLTFDPPADWKPAVLPGSTARLFYVRIRTTAGTADQAPIATTILGRDYVNANGTTSGTIPAFDFTADANHDGYLDDAEYTHRRAGFDARFTYESRLFYPSYGQMRFVTNPSGAGVAAWAGDYQKRFLAANSLADGIFMDNSGGRVPIDGASVIESVSSYSSDFDSLLGAVNRAIAPKWVLANTSNGGSAADGVASEVPATIEESAIRPLAANWSQVLDLANTVNQRVQLANAGYLILDSLSQGGSPTDPRTQIAALAYYYLLADPQQTMFMLWGGEEPASSWSRHWFDAIAYNVGQPKAAMSEFATGADPANPALAYHIYQRTYGNALVLYKPLSYTLGKGTGTTSDASATTHALNGRYRLLNADGTLGPVITSVTLRNGEGAILIRA